MQPDVGESRREDRERRFVLDLAGVADDCTGRHRQEHTGIEQVPDRVHHVVERAEEVRGDEAHEEVGVVRAELLEDLARRLAHRVCRHRVA